MTRVECGVHGLEALAEYFAERDEMYEAYKLLQRACYVFSNALLDGDGLTIPVTVSEEHLRIIKDYVIRIIKED